MRIRLPKRYQIKANREMNTVHLIFSSDDFENMVRELSEDETAAFFDNAGVKQFTQTISAEELFGDAGNKAQAD